MKKINIGIIFGGKSAEHEVSIQSAKNIINALDKNKYYPVLIYITKTGEWLLNNDFDQLLQEQGRKIALIPQGNGQIAYLLSNKFDNDFDISKIDVVFPILHGPYGEDGTIQGLLEIANLPFVGAGVLGSALGMDKAVAKQLLQAQGLPVAKFLIVNQTDFFDSALVKEKIGYPCFVKPANMGSSIGITKVNSDVELTLALDTAFLYDYKIIIEQAIVGRELECAVLGNDLPQASVVGEIITKDSFYSYQAKYINENISKLKIPADISQQLIKQIQDLSIQVFKILSCQGMGRVDFFLLDDNKIMINEINTIPGFTQISMYPKLWQASGLDYTELINRLIDLAIERFNNQQKLKTNIC